MLIHSEGDTQKGIILVDDVTFEPVLDFNTYSDIIVNIVNNSYPKFSLGIYGEWGTGKTTLMKIIQNKLDKTDEVLTVWFNAWRYEREDQFAIVALLKTVAYAMGEHRIYEGIKPIVLRAVKIITKGFLSEVAARYIGEKGVEEFKRSLLPQMDLLAEVDKDTIYFDGIHKIENEMRQILHKYPSSRIVVFIDDLDRCSPKKALEVFESVKVFLGIDGLIYIIGLSHETISKLISAEYKESEIQGDQYIRKIIQIPLTIQEWNADDVRLLIEDLLKKGMIHKKYYDIINNNKDLISKAVEHNPRELKRFINNFIVSYEIYSSNSSRPVNSKELLLVQALSVRWNKFYRLMVNSNKEFSEEVKKYAELTEDKRVNEFESDEPNEKFDPEFKKLLKGFKLDTNLWGFIRENSLTLFSIKDWGIYRRATESVKEYSTQPKKAELSESSRQLQKDIDYCLNVLHSLEYSDSASIPFKVTEALDPLARILDNEDYQGILGKRIDSLTKMHIQLRSNIRSFVHAQEIQQLDEARKIMMTIRALIADISGTLLSFTKTFSP